VVVGDSVALGIFEETEGYLPLGWTDRIAAELRAVAPDLEYLNLGQMDVRSSRVRADQIPAAVALRPDLALVACGANDAFSPRYRPEAVDEELTAMVVALKDAGAEVMTMSVLVLDDYPGLPEAIRADVPGRLRVWRQHSAALAAKLDTLHVDLTDHPSEHGGDLISADGVHGNGKSHAISAAAAVRRLGRRLGNL
jgi:lysophospholipase L1-like esterase